MCDTFEISNIGWLFADNLFSAENALVYMSLKFSNEAIYLSMPSQA